MKHLLTASLLLAALANILPAGAETVTETTTPTANPQVRLTTSHGPILLELDAEKAPKTVANFLEYVTSGHYAGTIFHRVINNFMVQGGGFTADFQQKPVQTPVENEANNGLKNDVGTIAMARTSAPHSATAQFFINVKDNDFLNHSAPTPTGWGYTVFGRVVEGMEAVDAIKVLPTGRGGPFGTDVPQPIVVIEKAEIVE